MNKKIIKLEYISDKLFRREHLYEDWQKVA